MGFVTENEAKHFLVEKIAARAMAEGCPLSDDERWMLGFSASGPVSGLDAARLHLVYTDAFGDQFEAKMARLLREAYDLDAKLSVSAQESYRDAFDALVAGDSTMSRVVESASGRWVPTWFGPIRRAGLFLVLVVPGVLALLIAAAGLWAAIRHLSQSVGEAVGMGVVALVFGVFASYLFALWRRERRR